MSGSIILIGIPKNPILTVLGFTVFVGYTRVRMIIFQANLLNSVQHNYKATLLSALSLFSIIGEIAAISLLARLIGFSNYSIGYLQYGIVVFCISCGLWLLVRFTSRQIQQYPVE
jgi:hypothetical protein